MGLVVSIKNTTKRLGVSQVRDLVACSQALRTQKKLPKMLPMLIATATLTAPAQKFLREQGVSFGTPQEFGLVQACKA